MENKNDIFGKRLKLLRNKTGKNQEAVANAIGISRARYSHYENNHVEPDIDLIRKLADYHNVTTDYLLGRSNSPKLTEKDERDIAKRMERFRDDLENADGLAFDGEPMSEEAKESLMEAMEYAFRQTQRINKKYIPKKYRKDNNVD